MEFIEFIEFLQAKWDTIMIVSAIGASLALCTFASLNVAIREFREGDYTNFGRSLLWLIFFGIPLIFLLTL